jgi:thiamine transport system ATP-binding protein
VSLSVEGVSVTIDGTAILRDVDLDLGDHEVVAVLGPSGSGKTTLLRVIAGLQAPTTGTVTVDGRDITRIPVHRRGVGLMFQDHALFPHRDVQGNVAFGLRMGGASRADIRARVDEVLDLVGLAGYGHRSIDALSGGERQRVALARALAPRPALILLDEPLGSLDRALRERLVDELAGVLRSTGVSAIYVTHDQAEAFAMGDRLAVMRGGTIAQTGRPDEVWSRPADAGVATIVGAATLVPVTVGPDGEVSGPWGEVAADPMGVTGRAFLVVRGDTFGIEVPAADAPLSGTVTRITFRGDHRVVTIAVAQHDAGPPLELDVVLLGSVWPRQGERVGLRPVHDPVVVPPAP